MTDQGIIQIRKSLLWVILVLICVLGLQMVLHFLVLPRMEISRVYLESQLPLSDKELLELGGLKGNENYLSLDVDQIRDNYERSPMIRKAYVEKNLPGTVRIVLYERIPLGMILRSLGPQEEVLHFDEEGCLFNTASPSVYRDLPVMSGFELEEGDAVLPESLIPLLRDMKVLKKTSPLIYGQISEISVNPSESVLHEMKLYLSAYTLPVILSSSITESSMKKILLVLDSLRNENMMKGFDYADYRTNQLVLKKRRDSSL